jgi:hypothetical protein
LNRFILAIVAALCSGCQCQLSGTPLDTMEKRLNPACWFADWSHDDTTESPQAAATPPAQ